MCQRHPVARWSCVRALGAPGNPRSLALGASFGIGDTAKQFWRASLGAFADLDLGGGTTDFGVEIPIYLSFASASAPVGYAGDYKGVLRVGPRLQWTKSSDVGWVTCRCEGGGLGGQAQRSEHAPGSRVEVLLNA